MPLTPRILRVRRTMPTHPTPIGAIPGTRTMVGTAVVEGTAGAGTRVGAAGVAQVGRPGPVVLLEEAAPVVAREGVVPPRALLKVPVDPAGSSRSPRQAGPPQL